MFDCFKSYQKNSTPFQNSELDVLEGDIDMELKEVKRLDDPH